MNLTASDISFMKNDIISNFVVDRNYMLPSEYCESVRYLPKELTPKSGFYDYNWTPYLREIVDNLSPMSDVRETVFMKPAQIGATTGVLEAGICYNIGSDPKPQLFISADKELVEKGMEVKVDRMIDGSGLRHLIRPQTGAKTNKTGDRKSEKDYPGGFLHAIGALSPGKLRSMNYPVGYFDELDAFQQILKNEGDPVALAKNRILIPYEDKAKILYLSTPLVLQTSKIYALYIQGDQRNYYVPCVNCGELIVLHWHLRESQTESGENAGIIFETDKNGKLIRKSVFYKCQHCTGLMTNDHKSIILTEGFWKPTAEPKKDRLRSYWLNALYSPVGMYSWAGMVESWLECWDIDKKRVKDVEKYREFRNTKEGKPFEELGEAPKFERVILHRRHYPKNTIPNKLAIADNGYPILIVLCSVDVQPSGFYVDIKGYTINGISYTIDFRFIDGNPLDKNNNCWQELRNIIDVEEWTADDGKKYYIRSTFIDAAWGESTENVYNFCSSYSNSVYPIFGEQWFKGEFSGITFKDAAKATIEKSGCTAVYKINTTKTKDRVAFAFKSDWTSGDIQPHWKPNFPDDFRDDYFKMFEAEYKAKQIERRTGRILGFFWVQVQGADNHAFDTFGYNLALLDLVAHYVCTHKLELESLHWDSFWDYAKEGHYYEN